MSRKGSIKYQIQQELLSICKFGESRHSAKIKGEAYKYIYSYNTFKTYLQQLNIMVKWSKDNGIKLKNIEDIRENGDKWLQSCVEQGLSAWTITTRRAALCKLCGVPYSFFETKMPVRKRSEIKRGRNPDAKRGFSEKLNENQVTFCKCTGVRYHELIVLKGTDLIKKGNDLYIHIRSGKGGKERFAKLYGTKEELNLCVELANKAENNKIFPHVKRKANTHSYRAQYCKRCYVSNERDLNQLSRSEKYYCRSDKKGTVYDRKALLICSQNLGHNRLDIVPSNYLF